MKTRFSFYGCVVIALLSLQTFGAKPESPSSTLNITSIPDGAAIIVDGCQCGVAPKTISGVSIGKHLIGATKHGYLDAFQTVEVASNNEIIPVTVELDPVTAPVIIDTDPQEASVSIDGIYKGTTPILIPAVLLGKHTVSFGKQGYLNRAMDLDISAATPKKLETKLLPDSATLSFTSVPEQASVCINGTPRGTTPITISRIAQGPCSIEVKKEGYDTYSQEIQLAAGDELDIPVTLDAIPATLSVLTTPPGVKIYMNDELMGESPLTLKGLKPGTYRVRTDSPVYDPMARNVTLAPAQITTEEFRLMANCGSLHVVTSPAGVIVLIDGKQAGKTPMNDDATTVISGSLDLPTVPVGTHELRFAKSGYYEARKTIDIARDKMENVEIALKRRFIPDYEITTDTGTYRGMLEGITGDFIRLETQIGVVRAFPRDSVRASRYLRDDEKSQPAEELANPKKNVNKPKAGAPDKEAEPAAPPAAD